MIIVSGVMDVAEDQRDAFLESKRDQVLRTRGETGCQQYAFSADAHAPGRVRLFELWDSFADLQAHVAGISSAGQSGPSIAVTSTDIQVFEASPTSPPWA
jgi:quinol monooxygenase YgiN